VTTRTWNDARVTARQSELEAAAGKGLGDLHAELAGLVQAVRAEKLKEVADEFDNIHDIKRAMRVGSVDRIIAPSELRPFIVHALERRLATTPPPAAGTSAGSPAASPA
jgi:hypothetical protein